MQRQNSLQPRVVLPAGRIVSLEEGRRLSKLAEDDEQRVYNEQNEFAIHHNTGEKSEIVVSGNGKGETAKDAVFVEDSIQRRILILRQQQHADANVKASTAYLKQQRNLYKKMNDSDSAKVSEIANEILRERSSDQKSHKWRNNRSKRVQQVNSRKRKSMK